MKRLINRIKSLKYTNGFISLEYTLIAGITILGGAIIMNHTAQKINHLNGRFESRIVKTIGDLRGNHTKDSNTGNGNIDSTIPTIQNIHAEFNTFGEIRITGAIVGSGQSLKVKFLTNDNQEYTGDLSEDGTFKENIPNKYMSTEIQINLIDGKSTIKTATVMAPSNEHVNIPDEALLRVINKALNKSDTSQKVTSMELASIEKLDISSNGIQNINGLQYATNLEILNTDNNNIRDFSALNDLTNLSVLHVDNNGLNNLDAFKGLKQLRELTVNKNNLTNLAPIYDFTHLTNLEAANNQLTDISALSNLMELKRVILDKNQLYDISPVKNLINLNVFSAYENHITNDISIFSSLINLTELTIYNNLITGDMSTITQLSNLKKLYIQGNKISHVLSKTTWPQLTDYQF